MFADTEILHRLAMDEALPNHQLRSCFVSFEIPVGMNSIFSTCIIDAFFSSNQSMFSSSRKFLLLLSLVEP